MYVVIGVLSLLLAVSMFVLVVILLQTYRRKEHKEAVVATDIGSSLELRSHERRQNLGVGELLCMIIIHTPCTVQLDLTEGCFFFGFIRWLCHLIGCHTPY